jgi:hypothetical protein
VTLPVALLVPEDDYDAPMSASEAAAYYGVALTTITSWVRKGYLSPIGHETRYGRRVPVYRLLDLDEAEARAYRNSRLGRRDRPGRI